MLIMQYKTGTGIPVAGDLLATLDMTDEQTGGGADYFGGSVGMSTNYVIVGAPATKDPANESGKAYIYSPSGTLLHTLDNPNHYGTPDVDKFGRAVDTSDTVCVIGTPSEDNAVAVGQGVAYVFNPSTGLELGFSPLTYPGSGTNSVSFGSDVGCTSSYIAVSAPRESNGSFTVGVVYVYDASTGNLLHTIAAPEQGVSDWFGEHISCGGNYLIVGVPRHDTGGSSSGRAYVYNMSTGALVQTLNNPNPDGSAAFDSFGSDVDITANYAVVGAPGEDEDGNASGKVYIFDPSTGTLLHTLSNPGAPTYDAFGSSVSVKGNIVAAGAQTDDTGGSNSGTVYLFDATTGGAPITTVTNPNAHGTADNDNFGGQIAMNQTAMVVGVPKETSALGQFYGGKAYIIKT